MTPPQHQVDVARVRGVSPSSFGEGEQCSLRRDDRRWNAVGVVSALAGDVGIGEQRGGRVLLPGDHRREGCEDDRNRENHRAHHSIARAPH